MKRLKISPRCSPTGAFTLIEIMVATVIMVVLVGLVIQITGEVLKVWNRSSGKLGMNAEARIAMDLITRDVEMAVLRNNQQQWLRVEGPVNMNNGAPYDPDNTVSLKLFSPALDRPDGVGDLCAIGYRLQYKESYPGGDPTYALYRRVVDPSTTFNQYLGSGDPSTSPQGTLIGSNWSDTGSNGITNDSNYLVGNIIEFKVLIYAQSDPLVPVNVDSAGILKEYAYGGVNGSTIPLLYADVTLRVISDEGLEILTLPSLSGTGYTSYQDVVRAHSDLFTRRVHFMARPL